ncbi:MAG: double-strand break repair protein AddB [Pseudomonadota bacterium]
MSDRNPPSHPDLSTAPWDADDWPRGIFTLPPTQPFLPSLAQGLLHRCRDNPMDLARITILLPTRRACRVLRQAFLDAADAQRPLPEMDAGDTQDSRADTVLLLPILRPIGDVDEDELILTDADPGLDPLPSPIGALDRQLRLARAIMAAAPAGEAPSPDMAIDLAAELARLLDQLHTEGVSFELLHDLVPDDFAAHWQEVLQFLDILGEHWPAVLEQLQALDPARYRDLWLRRAADRLARDDRSGPVLVAGSTGSIPATAHLMKTVLGLPNGTVILPGFDALETLEDIGFFLGESHAQHQMHQLLNRLSIALENVQEWPRPWSDNRLNPQDVEARKNLITCLTNGPMMGRQENDQEMTKFVGQTDPDITRNITPIICQGPEQEALVAALAMREVLDPRTPEKTAMLVTPDRDMARRVTLALKRYGIAINDSAGIPLSSTPVGQWLRLTARLLSDQWGPRDLLACFKHPFAALGRHPAQCRDVIRQLELILLRGPQPASGVDALLSALEHLEARQDHQPIDPSIIARCRAFLTDLAAARAAIEAPDATSLDTDADAQVSDTQAPDVHATDTRVAATQEPLLKAARPDDSVADDPLAEDAVANDPVTKHYAAEDYVPALVARHVAFAEALAATADEPGGTRLWQRDDGEAASAFMSELSVVGTGFPPMGWRHYGDFITGLMAERVVRPQRQAHPRLTILGLLEARLVEADRVILAGLNEGNWPPEPSADPWLSRPMRRRLGLPTPERRLGQTAHDFAQLLGAPEVFLLRAERQGGTPTIPARWMQFFEVLLTQWKAQELHLKPGPVSDMLARATAYQDWAQRLDQAAAATPRTAPAPCPAAPKRPGRVSVTDIELLIRNPYGFYARHVLGLRALDALELAPGAADKGAFIHQALERFCRRFPDELPPDAAQHLHEIGAQVFREVADRPDVHAFWWARFQRIAEWFLAEEATRRRPCSRQWAGSVPPDV